MLALEAIQYATSPIIRHSTPSKSARYPHAPAYGTSVRSRPVIRPKRRAQFRGWSKRKISRPRRGRANVCALAGWLFKIDRFCQLFDSCPTASAICRREHAIDGAACIRSTRKSRHGMRPRNQARQSGNRRFFPVGDKPRSDGEQPGASICIGSSRGKPCGCCIPFAQAISAGSRCSGVSGGAGLPWPTDSAGFAQTRNRCCAASEASMQSTRPGCGGIRALGLALIIKPLCVDVKRPRSKIRALL